MTNPFPFVAGATLTAAELNAIGETETWTPTFQTGVTVGNGTVTGTYQRINDLVVAQGTFVFGTTSAITGDVRVTNPVAASDLHEISNSTIVQINDFSFNRFFRGSGRPYGSSAVRLRVLKAETGSSDFAYAVALSSTVPMTWANGDRLSWTSIYRVG